METKSPSQDAAEGRPEACAAAVRGNAHCQAQLLSCRIVTLTLEQVYPFKRISL